MADNQATSSAQSSSQSLGLDKVLPITVLVGSALYFTGSEFLDSKAVKLGLAAAPGEPSLHKTMAVGASVILQFNFLLQLLIFITATAFYMFVIVYVVQRWVLPEAMSDRMQGIHTQAEQKHAEVKKKVRTLREADNAGEQIEQEVEALEAEVDEWFEKINEDMRDGRRRVSVSSFLLASAKFLPAGAFFMFVTSIGGDAGESAAEEIIGAVKGDCRECSSFAAGETSVMGIPAFQTGESVVIAYADGIAILPGIEPIISGPPPEGDAVVVSRAEESAKTNSEQPPIEANRGARAE